MKKQIEIINELCLSRNYVESLFLFDIIIAIIVKIISYCITVLIISIINFVKEFSINK